MSLVRSYRSVQQLGIGARHRAFSIVLALFITALLLVLLVSFGPLAPPSRTEKSISVVSVATSAPSPSSAEDSRPDPAPSDQLVTEPQTQVEQAPATKIVQQTPVPVADPLPTPPLPSAAERPAATAVPKIGVRMRGGAAAGPPGARSASAGDSERVGTMANGEPLYAAAWYREPTDAELRGYLSTATGPGWGLIACRTVADYRVEDCIGLDEYPAGSQMNRAVLAAAWQFRVRPTRLGGQPQVGTWVRIRIDYGIGRR